MLALESKNPALLFQCSSDKRKIPRLFFAEFQVVRYLGDICGIWGHYSD